MSNFTESVVEEAALAWLHGLGYAVLYGPAIAAGESAAERTDPNYRDVVLERRLRETLVRLNPDVSAEALEDAFRKLTRIDAPSLVERNRAVHRMLVDGITVEYRRADGSIAGEQTRALANYTDSGGKGQTAIDQAEAVAVMLEKYEICCGLFHGFDWSRWKRGAAAERLRVLPAAQEHVLTLKDGRERLMQAVTELSAAFTLAVPHEDALRIQDDVGFFQAVRAALVKSARVDWRPEEDLDFAIRQIVSRAVATDEVIDLFAAAGLKKPDISILSDEFLAEVRALPHKNLAVEVLRKLISGEIKRRAKKNVVQSRSFAELLEKSVRAYQNRAIETIEVIEELIALAKEIRDADKRGEQLGLTEDEVAFYDALGVNDSAVRVLGDETLMTIARELVATVRGNVTIDGH